MFISRTRYRALGEAAYARWVPTSFSFPQGMFPATVTPQLTLYHVLVSRNSTVWCRCQMPTLHQYSHDCSWTCASRGSLAMLWLPCWRSRRENPPYVCSRAHKKEKILGILTSAPDVRVPFVATFRLRIYSDAIRFLVSANLVPCLGRRVSSDGTFPPYREWFSGSDHQYSSTTASTKRNSTGLGGGHTCVASHSQRTFFASFTGHSYPPPMKLILQFSWLPTGDRVYDTGPFRPLA